MSIDTPYDFDGPLRALDSCLRCSICVSLFVAPVLISKCFHTFCSKCIREHLSQSSLPLSGPSTSTTASTSARSGGGGGGGGTARGRTTTNAAVRRQDCPICKAEIDVGMLKKNTVVEECVRAWESARADLLRYQANLLVPQANDEAKDSIEMNGRSLRSSNSKSKGKGKAVVPPATENPNKKGSNKGKAKVAQKEENSDDSDIEIIESVNQDPNDPNLIVPCPMCQAPFKNSLINLHLDKCTGSPPSRGNKHGQGAIWGNVMSSTQVGSSAKPGPSTKKVKERSRSKSPAVEIIEDTKRLAVIAYSGITLKELTKHFKTLDLPLSDRHGRTLPLDALKNRHRHFLLLWNANLDFESMDDPKRKSRAELLRELHEWEMRAESGTEVVAKASEHQRAYAPQFADLVKQARTSGLALRNRPAAAPSSSVTVEETPCHVVSAVRSSTSPSASKGAETTSGVDTSLVVPVAALPFVMSSPTPPGSPRDRPVDLMEKTLKRKVAFEDDDDHVPDEKRPRVAADEVSQPETEEKHQEAKSEEDEEEEEEEEEPEWEYDGPRPSQRMKEDEWKVSTSLRQRALLARHGGGIRGGGGGGVGERIEEETSDSE